MTVASLDWLQDAKDLEADLSGLTVHLKLDTGMGRIGFRKIADLLQAMETIEELEYDIEGVYTHFATADEVDQAHFESQLSVLKNFWMFYQFLRAGFMPAIQQQAFGMLIQYLTWFVWETFFMDLIRVDEY